MRRKTTAKSISKSSRVRKGRGKPQIIKGEAKGAALEKKVQTIWREALEMNLIRAGALKKGLDAEEADLDRAKAVERLERTFALALKYFSTFSLNCTALNLALTLDSEIGTDCYRPLLHWECVEERAKAKLRARLAVIGGGK